MEFDSPAPKVESKKTKRRAPEGEPRRVGGAAMSEGHRFSRESGPQKPNADKPNRPLFYRPEALPLPPPLELINPDKKKNSLDSKSDKFVVLQESAPVSNAEAPTNQIAPKVEMPVATAALASEGRRRIEANPADPVSDPVGSAGDELASEMYRLSDEEGMTPAQSYQAVVEKAGLDPHEAPEATPSVPVPTELLPHADEASAEVLPVESVPESDNDTTDPEADITDTAEAPDTGEAVVFDRAAEANPDVESDDADDPVTPLGGHGGAEPPTPPAGGGGGGGGGAGGHGGGPAPFAMAPTAAHFPGGVPTPNLPRNYNQNAGYNPASAALVGAIVGYLVGRRRGRIKTEKRLLPIQRRLEHQVNDLDAQFKNNEAKLRRLANRYVQQPGRPGKLSVHPDRLVAAEAATKAAESRAQKAEKQPQHAVAVAKNMERERTERQKAPEAHQLHGATKAPEHIGHMLLNAESIPFAKLDKPNAEKLSELHSEAKTQQTKEAIENQKPVEKVKLPHDKQIETLSRAELLGMSEKIMVDGSSLRQIYESHLVGDKGLRRLMAEHLSGGDLKQALRREIVEREIDFERDPIMRDASEGAVSGGGTAPHSKNAAVGGKAALDQLVAQAASQVSGSNNEENAFYKARANYEVEQLEQHQARRHKIDITFAVIITGLVVIVAVLYLMRN